MRTAGPGRARRWRPGPTLGSSGRRARIGSGTRHEPGQRDSAWGSGKFTVRAVKGRPGRRRGRTGVRKSPGTRGSSAQLPHPTLSPFAGSPDARPRLGPHEQARVSGNDEATAAARTRSSNWLLHHPQRRPGQPRGRPAGRGVHLRRPLAHGLGGCRRAPLCNVNFSGTNCLLIVWKRSGYHSFFFSLSVFISAWPLAMPWAASPSSSFLFISIS